MTFQHISTPASKVFADLKAKLDADAQKLAAEFGFNERALYDEYNRRSFGSYTLTRDGSPEQRDRYLRAWSVAVEHNKKSEAA